MSDLNAPDSPDCQNGLGNAPGIKQGTVVRLSADGEFIGEAPLKLGFGMLGVCTYLGPVLEVPKDSTTITIEFPGLPLPKVEKSMGSLVFKEGKANLAVSNEDLGFSDESKEAGVTSQADGAWDDGYQRGYGFAMQVDGDLLTETPASACRTIRQVMEGNGIFPYDSWLGFEGGCVAGVNAALKDLNG